jgi:hypothetical protein
VNPCGGLERSAGERLEKPLGTWATKLDHSAVCSEVLMPET